MMTPVNVNSKISTSAITILLIIFFSFSTPLKSDEWRGWRGLEKQACGDTMNGQVNWSSTRNVLWKVEIEGEGHSSPVVSDKYVFVTTAIYDDSKVNLNRIIVNLIFFLLIVFILYKSFSHFKYLYINRRISSSGYFYELTVFSLYGFLIFIFCILYWMHFDENRIQPERILINYLISGSVFFLCLLLFISGIPKKSLIRVLAALIIICLVGFLVKNIPLQGYYQRSDFFQIWSFQLIIPSIILPLILSIFLLFKTLVLKFLSKSFPYDNVKKSDYKNFSAGYNVVTIFSAFLLGVTGYMAIPVITYLKIIFSDKLSRIRESTGINTFLNPDFAYPFFLGILSIGFLFWLIIENKKHEYNRKEHYCFYSVLLAVSAVFFIMNNIAPKTPEYRRAIICIDRYTGVTLWKIDCLKGPAIGNSIHNSQATPTPLINNNSVFAYFGSAGMVSADFEGNLKWENKDLPFKSIHGVGVSPVSSREGIIILSSMSESPYLTSLDSNTGSQQWKNDLRGRKDPLGEYRTPLVFEYDGQELIIEWSVLRNELVLYLAKTGEVMYIYNPNWSCSGESVTTPVIKDDIIYLSNVLNVASVNIKEVINANSPVVWITELNGRGPETSSPVLAEGMLFMASDNGYITCMSAKTGKILWQEKLPGTYFSSPVIFGKRVYFSNTSGLTTVLECSGVFKIIAENKLPEGIYSTIVPVDGQLFIRTKNTLWCLR